MRITTMSLRWMSMLIALTIAAPAFAADHCGDADGSGAVTVTDGVQTLRAAAGLSSTCTLARCDLDGGGTISVTDGVNVLRAAAGLAVNLGCPGDPVECAGVVVTVTLDVPQPIGAATVVVDYPQAASIPGVGEEAAARVTLLTQTPLFGNGQPNDLDDDRVQFSLVAPDGLGDGALLSIDFDCVGVPPDAALFSCTVADTFATDGVTPVTGARCTLGAVAK
jgi:hypothetical protein